MVLVAIFVAGFCSVAGFCGDRRGGEFEFMGIGVVEGVDLWGLA